MKEVQEMFSMLGVGVFCCVGVHVYNDRGFNEKIRAARCLWREFLKNYLSFFESFESVKIVPSSGNNDFWCLVVGGKMKTMKVQFSV
jgi:hypothetical protein